MYAFRLTAHERSRRRVRASLWLAICLALAVPAWLAAAPSLLSGPAAVLASLAPIVAYVTWRVCCEATEEDDAGISRLDRVWVYVEKHLPNEGVRRVAWRTVRAVVFLGAAAGLGAAFLLLRPRGEETRPVAPAVVAPPPVEVETPFEPRLISGRFAMKVEIYPQMIWPAYGTVASFYGPDNPLGMDVYVGGDARVMAAMSGNVAYAGPDICCGYGFSIVVDHDDGWQTTYGNLAAITVKQGGRVKAGETIGRGGAAESNDSPRVHFQVQRNGRAYDPLYVLPVTQMGLPAQPATNAVCGAEAITLDANSVVNLSITSDALRRYELEAASVTAVSDGAPEIAPGTLGLLSLVLQVPPGAGADYLLHLTLSKPGDRIAFDCDLALRNATDVPLSVAPPVRQTAPVAPTPFGGPPTATPTVTPFPSPTATPLPADAAVEARPQARPEVPSPTPFGGQRPSATPAPSATPDTRKNKPSLPSMLHAAGTPRAVTTPTPTRVPLAAFPRQYAGAAPQP